MEIGHSPRTTEPACSGGDSEHSFDDDDVCQVSILDVNILSLCSLN